jgi:hypothetical protein
VSALQILGAVMLAIPLLGLFAFTVWNHTWREVAFLWGFVGAIFALIWGGNYLLAHG